MVLQELLDVILGRQHAFHRLVRIDFLAGQQLGHGIDRHAAHREGRLRHGGVERAVLHALQTADVAVVTDDPDLVIRLRQLDRLCGAQRDTVGLAEDDRNGRIALQHVLCELVAFVSRPALGPLILRDLDVRASLQAFGKALEAVDFRRGTFLAVNDDGVFYKRRELGLVNDVFTKDVLETMPRGNMCIGHCRYATTGVPVRSNAQPFVIRHIKGPMALAHNGNLSNAGKLRDELEKLDCEVIEAENGKEAVLMDLQEKPDGVILDIVMPEVGGIEALQVIKEVNPEIPVIMLSSAGTSQKLMETLKLGALDFIQKPYTSDQIRQAVEKIRKKVTLNE